MRSVKVERDQADSGPEDRKCRQGRPERHDPAARGREAWGTDFARGRGARGAGRGAQVYTPMRPCQP